MRDLAHDPCTPMVSVRFGRERDIYLRVAMRRCLSRDDAEDLLQVAAASLFRHPDGANILSDARRLSGYVDKMAVHRRHRINQSPPSLPLEYAEECVDHRPGPQAVILHAARLRELRGALRALPAEDALIVRSRTRGLSYAQIARELGLNESTARQRYHRACLRLRRRLGPSE